MNSKGSNGAAERAVQSVEAVARTLRLDLLSRTNIAVGSDLPITSRMVRHAAWLLSHFQIGSADGKTSYARQFERPHESLVLPFVERVMWKDPTLQPAKLKSSWGYVLWFRTIRRLPASEREDSNLEVAMRGTPVAGRPADAAAGEAPTVTRHAVEHGEELVVPASCGAPLQAGSGDSAPSNPVPSLPKPTVARAQPSSAAAESSHHPEVAQAVEPTTKSHAPVEKHDESLVPKRRRGRPATHCWPSLGSPEYTVGCPGCDGRSYRHLLKCQQKRIELGFSASSRLRDVRGDVVMEEAPPPPPPAEPPPVLRTSDETDAMTLAAVHPYGHEEPLEISWTEFESFVRDGFYFEEDTLEELPLDEVVEGVNRELNLMKSFPVYQAVPRDEVTGKVWSTRRCYRRKGPKQVRARFVVGQFAYSLDANFYSPTRGLEVTSVVSDGSVERPHQFVR